MTVWDPAHGTPLRWKLLDQVLDFLFVMDGAVGLAHRWGGGGLPVWVTP